MLDFDLAQLYGVTKVDASLDDLSRDRELVLGGGLFLTGNLNLAVRRNKNRFPDDFMFQLTAEEPNLCSCKLQDQRLVAPNTAIRVHGARCRHAF